ncbi:Transmembrane protein 120A [Fasciola hepatica]|uniref:Transmembrane protein 120A n=1 Tax=Fasciola hepatica TaxID=6192 RepID=A0A4E0RUH4_FASHE|nr:Transmembrane protein 120A [Fasciola hepatica]
MITYFSFALCFRIVDALFHFLLVWYYCTLTIRERILIANGSRIKGWWNIYHFISTACAGIMLIWPHSRSYDEFRNQFMLFSFYLNIVHCIQYRYQVGCLYKLRALGDRHPMDVTVDGFMSWMFRHLKFILPFLFCAYGLELFNAYRLYTISKEPYCHEWQVLAVSIIYFIISMGNIITVCRVIRQKMFLPPPNVVRFQLSRKYSFARPQIAQVELAATYRRHQEERDNHQENHMEAAHTEAVIPEDAAVFTSEEGKKKS